MLSFFGNFLQDQQEHKPKMFLNDLTDLYQEERKFKNLLVLATLSCFTFVNGDVYSTCYEYETYCLFSFGPNVTVNNVNEAQKICENAKNGSWLLEIVDKRTLKNVDEFLSNHSFPEDTKLILNAEKVADEWNWIKITSVVHRDIRNLLNDNGYALFYQHSKKSRKNENHHFTFICSTGCHSKIIKHELKRYANATFHTNKSKEQCLELCEQSVCEGWEWKSDVNINGCWIHGTFTGNLTESIGTLFVMNKTVKTTDICVGNVTEPTDPKPNTIYLVIVPFILITVLLFTFGFLLWKRYKKRDVDFRRNDPAPSYANTCCADTADTWTDIDKNSHYVMVTDPQTKSSRSPIYASPFDKPPKISKVDSPVAIYSEVIL